MLVWLPYERAVAMAVQLPGYSLIIIFVEETFFTYVVFKKDGRCNLAMYKNIQISLPFYSQLNLNWSVQSSNCGPRVKCRLHADYKYNMHAQCIVLFALLGADHKHDLSG